VADQRLTPALRSLFAEFDAISPKRSKKSDGAIGDQAHRDRVSDHNLDDTPGSRTPFTDADTRPEIHAIDVTAAGPWPDDWGFPRQVRTVVDRHRRGVDDRLQNVIYDGRIASRSNGWVWQTYDGSDPHTGHAHFSGRYTTAQENDTRPWGLKAAIDAEKELPVDQAEFNRLMDGWAATSKGKAALESAAKADVVQRLDADGDPVPATDPNPRQGVDSSLRYVARDLALLKKDVKALLDKAAEQPSEPETPPAPAKPTPAKAAQAAK
jgi:hypothetical protein